MIKQTARSKGILGALILLHVLSVSGVLYLTLARSDLSLSGMESRRRIAVSLADLSDEYNQVLLQNIQSLVEARGDLVLTRDPGGDPEQQERQIQELLTMGVDTLVLSPVDPERLSYLTELSGEAGAKVVLLEACQNALPEGEKAQAMEQVSHSVCSDDVGAGALLGDFLLTENPSARVLLLGEEGFSRSELRISGFLNALEGSDAAVAGEILLKDGSRSAAMEAVEEVLSSGISFDTVFCSSDPYGIGCCAALRHNARSSAVRILSVGGSPEGKRMTAEGHFLAESLLFPSLTARYTVEYLYEESPYPDLRERVAASALVSRYNVRSYDLDTWE